MDKAAIERFAINARLKLKQSVTERMASLGISFDGTIAPVHMIGDAAIVTLSNGMETRLSKVSADAREQLIQRINESGFDNIVEAVAYTWFNRIIAIRYMEVNDYLPTHVRVLSSITPGKNEPDIVTKCFSCGIDIPKEKRDQIEDYRDKGESDKIFAQMFLLQCRELNKILPELFVITKPYEDLLLKLSFTDRDGVIRDLVDSIPEVDFRDAVQIIGWMYQYYNTELKADTFAKLKKNTKISKERIPSATQLFTPDWIVRYMAENSVGRIWLEGHDDPDLKNKWRYYLDEAEQEPEVVKKLEEIRKDRKKLSPASIKVIDPCMGSGHILVYTFDILMQIYQSYGYSKEESASSIIENNLYGLDIDDRAYQLAYFAVMMKARQYDPKLFEKNVRNNIHTIIETANIEEEDLSIYGNTMAPLDRHSAIADVRYIIQSFKNGKMFGSLIDIRECDWRLMRRFLADRRIDISVDPAIHYEIQEVIEIAKVLSQKYDIVITNPPYMGSSGMEPDLAEFVKSNYPDAKADLFACFIERVGNMTCDYGFYSMITMQAFMFLSSFEKIREKIGGQTIINMAHLGSHGFDEIGGEVVQTSSFVMSKTIMLNYVATYQRLIDGCCESEKEQMFLSKKHLFYTKQNNFLKIPGEPIAYWLNEKIFSLFNDNDNLSSISNSRIGMATGRNDTYLRLWHEVNINSIGFSMNRESAKKSGLKWFPYDKGGEYRKWYGNKDYVVNWFDDGYEIQSTMHPDGKRIWAHNFNLDYIFKQHISWTNLTSGPLSFRLFDDGFLFDSSASVAFVDTIDCRYLMGFLNSSLVNDLSKVLNPTLHFNPGDYDKLPYLASKYDDEIKNLVDINIHLSKTEWDSREISWDFKRHPLIHGDSVRDSCHKWIDEINQIILKLTDNDKKINEMICDTYGVSSIDPIDPQYSLMAIDETCCVKTMISYAVGCIFGRFSLDNDGIIYAGGYYNSSNYTKFSADDDNIIPINDDEYFGDDIVTRFVEFLKAAFGQEHLDDNIKFVADSLGVKGSGTSKEKIRKYFLNNFYKDHLKMYQKRPIYWLFDSGKENGFKALIYMHRYDKDLIGRMRQNYLLPMLGRYRDQEAKETDQVRRTGLSKKIEEIARYDLAMELYSSNKISIDLDDGVKVNYAKFQNIENSRSSKDKIDLLYRI